MFMLFVSLAVAGEIQVQTGNPVVVTVDGTFLPYPDGQLVVTAKDLAGGTHTVEVKNLLGKPITSLQVDVGPTEQVRLSYQAKTLTKTGAGEMAPQAAAAVPSAAPEAGSPVAMDVLTFNALRASIQKESMDLQRAGAIEDAASSNWFTVGQVVQLLRLIDNEATKSRVAEAFVGRVVDPQNAELIKSAFENDASGNMAAGRFD